MPTVRLSDSGRRVDDRGDDRGRPSSSGNDHYRDRPRDDYRDRPRDDYRDRPRDEYRDRPRDDYSRGRSDDRDDRDRPRDDYGSRRAEPSRRERSRSRSRGRSRWEDGGSSSAPAAAPPSWLSDLMPGAPEMPMAPAGPMASYQQQTKTLMIPAALKGGLIGKGGVEIQKIRTATKCSISMSADNPGDPLVALQLTGNVAAAEIMINERIAMLQKQHEESRPPWVKPDKNQWLVDKLTAEGTAPERIAQLLAVMQSKRRVE